MSKENISEFRFKAQIDGEMKRSNSTLENQIAYAITKEYGQRVLENPMSGDYTNLQEVSSTLSEFMKKTECTVMGEGNERLITLSNPELLAYDIWSKKRYGEDFKLTPSIENTINSVSGLKETSPLSEKEAQKISKTASKTNLEKQSRPTGR